MKKDEILTSMILRKYSIGLKLKKLKERFRVLFYEIYLKYNSEYIIKVPDEYDKDYGWKYFKIIVKKDKKITGKIFKLYFGKKFPTDSISMLDVEFMNAYYDIKCCRSNLWKIGRRINLINKGD